MPTNLQNKTTYGWRARGEQGALFGPWSATWTFITPDQPQAYIRGGELYDPLIRREDDGRGVGPVTFIPGVRCPARGLHSHIR